MFLTLVPLLLASRAKPAPVHAGPGREFTLVPGQVANVEGENIAIEFVNVVVDSRRSFADPSGGDGEVSCLILMTDLAIRSRPYRGLLTQSGPVGQPAIRMVDGRELVFDVEPRTGEREAIGAGQYRIRMTVLKRAKTTCAG